ncbi:class IV adenylate cyclase [Kitasatospora sp. MY 5-36]|uniref:class IV adenylate cyclase n=1 Tax=Kitasatospora sp. MY 5-36 TaxID=1678027 RepID=UPI000AE7863F|nr:class IV adenylate cyclase [Kitasatospora sp. MY 5-36]
MTETTEVERKRELPDDGSGITRLLAELGYRPEAPVTEEDTYYSRPDIDYMQTVECLRVRRRGDFAEITYKPASNGTTHREDDMVSKVETNAVLAGAAQAISAERLLQNIGMRELVRVVKTRVTHRHPEIPGVSVSIDTVAGAGVFVETEVVRAAPDGAAELVEEIEKALGIVGHPTVSLPYRDLVLGQAER